MIAPTAISEYDYVLLQRRYLDLKFAVDGRSQQLLAAELRRAKDEHTKFEAENGPDEDWATWYAGFMLGGFAVPSDLATTPPTKEQLDAD